MAEIKTPTRQAGFTLLEVIMTIVILVTLSVAATNVIQNSLTIREGVSAQMKASHGINAVMQRVAADIEAAFIISTLDERYAPLERRTKTVFQVERDGTVRMTTMSHKPLSHNSHESDQTLVVYDIKDDREHPGRKDLYRGEAKVIPESLKDEIPMHLFARGVQKFEIEPWTGQEWSDDAWDTNRNEHRNMLPRMVRIRIEMLEIDEEDLTDKRAVEEIPTNYMATIVYLPKSWGFPEYKPYSGSLKWN